MTIEKVINEIAFWLEQEGVEGVAQGVQDDEDCIDVFVSRPGLEKELPANYKGFNVVIKFTGEFNALDTML